MKPGPQAARTALRGRTDVPFVFSDGLAHPLAAAILKAMSDATSRAIMNSLIAHGKSIEEIASEGIPPSTAYRRVRKLCENGLIVVERVRTTRRGKKCVIYRSALQGAEIDVRSDRVRVVGIPNAGVPDSAFMLWQLAESSRESP